MPFPEVEHVVYARNTLNQVICQLRFPPILRIDAKEPDEFQDRVRRTLPNYSQGSEFKIQLPPEIESQIPSVIMSQMPQSISNKNYEFVSRDENWKVNLTRTFVSLSTRSYQRWEDFTEKLEIPVMAFVQIYEPDDYTRLGLRYINVIRRSEFGIGNQPWRELISNPVLGIVSDSGFGETVVHAEGKFEVPLNDGVSLVRMRVGFVPAADTDEILFKIDNDFFRREATPISAYEEVLEYLHLRARRLFRWCITDRLHETMEPANV